jgi:hypothetical protein
MITQHTKYDPEYHSNIPRNFREWCNRERSNHDLTAITDEQIFNAWRDLYCVDTSEYDDSGSDGLYIIMLDELAP